MRSTEHQSSSDKSTADPRQASGSQAPNAGTEQRWQMVAEAAYFIAEHRGFSGGDPVQDWLAAESEIDTLFYSKRPASAEEASAYAHLRDEVRKALSQIQDIVDADAVKGAFERGVNEVKRAENYSAEVLHKVTATLREDMARAAERMGPAWEHFSERSADTFSVWADRSRSFLSRSATAVREWLHHEHRGAGH